VTGPDRCLRISRCVWQLSAIARDTGPVSGASRLAGRCGPIRRATTTQPARIASHVGTFQVRRPSGTISHVCAIRASRIFRHMVRRTSGNSRA
jgi:hypothetical protein